MVQNFFQTYFINPVLNNGWFNPINTITYGIILVAAVYLVYKLLKKMKIDIDKYFLYAILPFILWGSSTRVLHDAAVLNMLSPELNQFYSLSIFPTPGSYIITFTLALGILMVSLLLSKVSLFDKIRRGARSSYWSIMFIIGSVLSIINLSLLPEYNLIVFSFIVGTALLWSILFYIIYRFVSSRKFYTPSVKAALSKQNQLILGAHFLDASTTFYALSIFGYIEQHVVPRLFNVIMGPISMFLLKVAIVIPVLYIIDRHAEDGNFKTFLKIVVLILGLAPGLRNLIRLMVGV